MGGFPGGGGCFDGRSKKSDMQEKGAIQRKNQLGIEKLEKQTWEGSKKKSSAVRRGGIG